MDEWISYSGWRRDPLKGHDTKRGVRAMLRYFRERPSRNLRIFARSVAEDGSLTYTEIPAELWDETFAEEAA